MSRLLESGVLADAVVAASERDAQDLWAIRDSTSEYSRVLGPIIGFDVGLPTALMGEAVERLERELLAGWGDARVLCYGHVGDSNLHVVVTVPSAGNDQPHHAVEELVYGIVRGLGGTISAEHGIGLIKKTYLAYTRTAEEGARMRQLMAALEPRIVLIPVKVF